MRGMDGQRPPPPPATTMKQSNRAGAHHFKLVRNDVSNHDLQHCQVYCRSLAIIDLKSSLDIPIKFHHYF